jgi:hypothetical protein
MTELKPGEQEWLHAAGLRLEKAQSNMCSINSRLKPGLQHTNQPLPLAPYNAFLWFGQDVKNDSKEEPVIIRKVV